MQLHIDNNSELHKLKFVTDKALCILFSLELIQVDLREIEIRRLRFFD